MHHAADTAGKRAVEKYAYDYCYDNDRELTEAKDDFVRFLQDILGF